MEQNARIIQNTLINSGVAQAIIDAGAFYAGNKVLQDILKYTKVDLLDTAVFAGTDILIRSFSPLDTKTLGPIKLNGVLALSFLGTNTLINVLSGKELMLSLKKNLIKSAAGFTSNNIVDMLIKPSYI